MKRTKKLLALVLAMMMAFSIMAVTAAAAGSEEDGIMPLGLFGPCEYCGAMTPFETSEHSEDVRVNVPGNSSSSRTCSAVAGEHTHTVTIYTYSYRCTECGKKGGRTHSYSECWGGQ